MNLNRLSTGGRLIVAAGLLLFIDSFLPWFRACVDLGGLLGGEGGEVCGDAHTGWSNALSLLGILLAVAMAVVVVLQASGTALPALGSLSWSQVMLGAGVLSALLIVLQLIVGDSPGERAYGAWIGAVLALLLLAGAVLYSREADRTRL